MAFQPVPTYADPAEVNPRTGKFQFSPTWLSWFLSLTNGGLGQTLLHNSLQGLQGGVSGQYYHLSQSQLAAVNFRVLTAPAPIIPSGSPYTYQNLTTNDFDIIVQGGAVSLIEFSRDNVTYYATGVTQGWHRLSPGDYLRVTYGSVPNLTGVTR